MKTYDSHDAQLLRDDSRLSEHAYTTLAWRGTLLARFMRLDGYKVFFLTGTESMGPSEGREIRPGGGRRRYGPAAAVHRQKVSQNFSGPRERR